MPIAPPPTQLRCPQCNWNTVEKHRSDCRVGGPMRSCPSCDHIPLERETLPFAPQKILEKFAQMADLFFR